MPDPMYSIFVAINVKSEHRESFIEASITEAQGAISGEPGLFQFQMLVDDSNPNRFYFYEIFKDEKAAENHWETDVFKTWWNAVEGMFDGKPETICAMRTIFPSNSGLEKQKPGLMNW
jgi:quinol monooxygenase YgiN